MSVGSQALEDDLTFTYNVTTRMVNISQTLTNKCYT